MTTQPPLRVPIRIAAERGVAWLSETAGERPVLLTEFGRVVLVVDSAERLDDTVAKLDIAARAVVERFVDLASGRGSRWSLEQVCAGAGIDPERVRARAHELRSSPVRQLLMQT